MPTTLLSPANALIENDRAWTLHQANNTQSANNWNPLPPSTRTLRNSDIGILGDQAKL
jgi:hypothetical protein